MLKFGGIGGVVFVSGSIRKAVSNGKCWRFGGLVFYTLSILRNHKKDFQEPQEVWIDFQEPEEVGVVVSPIAVKKVFIKVDSKSKSFVACCAQGWRSRRIRFVNGSICKAVSRGKYWRFGGVFFTRFRLNNVKRC